MTSNVTKDAIILRDILASIPPPAPRIAGWADIIGSGLMLAGGGANQPSFTAVTGTTDLVLPEFTYNGDKYGYINFHIPHDYIPGTEVYMHVHWVHGTTGPTTTQVVRWTLKYTIAKGHSQEAFATSATSLNIDCYPSSTTRMHQVNECTTSQAIPASAVEIDGMLSIKVGRYGASDAADTFADSVWLVGVDLHYQSDGVRTVERVAPFTKSSAMG